MSTDFSRFERYTRVSVPDNKFTDPGLLYDLCQYSSLTALGLAYHYDGTHVSAVAPIIDDGTQLDPNRPVLKIVSAGNFKPVKETDEYAPYTRVCAEQNLIDNALVIGDTLIGAMFIRISKKSSDFEGNKTTEAPHFCQPCRLRALPIVGPKLVVVSFVGNSDIPYEALNIQQMIEHHDFGKPPHVIARGAEVKEYVIEEVLKTARFSKKVETLPRVPSRRYKRSKPQ